MKQEYILILIIGLFIAAYVLEAIGLPLEVILPSQFHYINPEFITTHPYTVTVILVRAIAIFLVPVWLMSFIEKKYTLKAGMSLLLAALTQLYVLQELAQGAVLIPLEWSLALAFAGLGFLPMIAVYILLSGISAAHSTLVKDKVSKESGVTTEQENVSE